MQNHITLFHFCIFGKNNRINRRKYQYITPIITPSLYSYSFLRYLQTGLSNLVYPLKVKVEPTRVRLYQFRAFELKWKSYLEVQFNANLFRTKAK